MDILTWLKPLAEFEGALADLYEWMSELYFDDAEASFVFFHLSRDERSHVDLVDFLRRLVRKDPSQFSGFDLDIAELESARERVRGVREQPQPPAVDASLTLALELEVGAAEFHFRSALGQSNPEVGRLLDSLGRGDREHQARLLDLAQKRGLVVPS